MPEMRVHVAMDSDRLIVSKWAEYDPEGLDAIKEIMRNWPGMNHLTITLDALVAGGEDPQVFINPAHVHYVVVELKPDPPTPDPEAAADELWGGQQLREPAPMPW